MSNPTVYFITGANRGIGLALTKELLQTKSDVYIFAGARNTSTDLTALALKYSDKLAIVPFVAADEASNRAAAKVVNEKFGHVDVVLGVAGIADYVGPAEETPADSLTQHLKVNVTGILVLYQAFAALLRKSANPKFIPFTSGLASLTEYISMLAQFTCYGASKAAMNYVARKIHFENEWIVCFPLAPGAVETDMAHATRAMDRTGTVAAIQDALAIKPDVAAKLLVGVIDSATRETHGDGNVPMDCSIFSLLD